MQYVKLLRFLHLLWDKLSLENFLIKLMNMRINQQKKWEEDLQILRIKYELLFYCLEDMKLEENSWLQRNWLIR